MNFRDFLSFNRLSQESTISLR